ncbi:MAG: hypothetical protein AAF790_09290 [Planctomycetota bacterium]
MVRITIDEATRKKLFSSANGDVIELLDESGKLLGRIVPQADNFPEGWEPLTPELTEEELQRRAEYEGPGITTDELLARLRNRGGGGAANGNSGAEP